MNIMGFYDMETSFCPADFLTQNLLEICADIGTTQDAPKVYPIDSKNCVEYLEGKQPAAVRYLRNETRILDTDSGEVETVGNVFIIDLEVLRLINPAMEEIAKKGPLHLLHELWREVIYNIRIYIQMNSLNPYDLLPRSVLEEIWKTSRMGRRTIERFKMLTQQSPQNSHSIIDALCAEHIAITGMWRSLTPSIGEIDAEFDYQEFKEFLRITESDYQRNPPFLHVRKGDGNA